MNRKRNFAIWVLILVAVIAGILAILDAARYMGWLPAASFGELNFFIPDAYWLGALLSLFIGIIWFAVARWLYNLDPRGWLFVLVISVLNLFLLLLAWLGQSSWEAVSLGVIVNAIALLLAILPSTKAAFEQRINEM